ncbi:MAG TPA: DNA polymerase II [Leucothrix mucor]|nr:DNA polymerase II [Leucothrix mucor]
MNNELTTIKGFLLTRQWRDTADGVELIYWLKSSEGAVRVLITGQQAVCFIRESNQLKTPAKMQRKALALKTFADEPVDGLYFQQQRDLTALRDHLAYDKTQLLESEIKPTERYLMERFITASLQVQGVAIQREGYREFINPKLISSDYEPDLSWVSLDIETEDLRGRLYSIAVLTAEGSRVFISKLKPDGIESPAPEHIEWYKTEREVLQAFFQWMKQYDPDLILGWNVVGFDLDFLQWKCKRLRIPFDLGRGDDNAVILVAQQSGHVTLPRISGRAVLDGISCLKSAFWSFESFALGFVAQELLGRDKLIESGDDKLAEIRRQYREAPLELAEYNLEDCRLVADIFAKTDLINFNIQRAKMTGLAIDRHGGSMAAFDHLYLPRLHRKGYVAPDIGSDPNPKNSPGGYVMDSKPGLYKNVLVLDFKSLYPSIIRTFKIDPLGLLVGLKSSENDTIAGFLDARFSRDQHILPDIVTELWGQRDKAKKDKNAPLSQAVKIIMNSFYGVLGSFGCRFFNPQLASSITKRGHEIIQKSREVIEAQGYPVIYGDTDSVFVSLDENLSEKESVKIGENLAGILNEWWTNHLMQAFQISSNLEVEFETHYHHFFMPTVRGADIGSKKRYAGVVKKNGEMKMVFKGLETVRTDWTLLAREFQQELYRRIFFDEPFIEFVKETNDKLWRGDCDDKLVYKKRLLRPLETYAKTQSPHVKAALKMKNPSRVIKYIITLEGAEPIENKPENIDYQHYADKQLAPVADSILRFKDTSFELITQRQMDVFG